ncbi:hypothetical protein [Streptomyces finlayi]
MTRRGASGWALTAEQVARLDAASARPVPYPYDWINSVEGRI